MSDDNRINSQELDRFITRDDDRPAQTVQTWAKEAAGYFTTMTRDNGDVITITKDDRPDWLTALIRETHGDMLPDDWRYKMIEEALDAIAEAEDLDEAETEYADDVDVYTSNLTEWLSSRADRHGYVDEAVAQYGHADGGVMDDIARGQAQERSEVFASVRASLEALAEE